MSPAVFEDETVDGSTHAIAVNGELDMSNAGALLRRIEEVLADGRARIIVDLSGVTHLDSSGLAALISAHQRAVERRRGLALVVGTQAIRRTLEIRGVRDLFEIAETREQALEALRR